MLISEFQQSIDSILGTYTPIIDPVTNAMMYDVPYIVRALFLGIGIFMTFKLIITFVASVTR